MAVETLVVDEEEARMSHELAVKLARLRQRNGELRRTLARVLVSAQAFEREAGIARAITLDDDTGRDL